MSDLVLSRSEIAALARSPFKARQVAFLRQNGIRHYVDGHGWPVVLRSAVEGDQGPAKVAEQRWTPRKAANG